MIWLGKQVPLKREDDGVMQTYDHTCWRCGYVLKGRPYTEDWFLCDGTALHGEVTHPVTDMIATFPVYSDA